MFKKIPLTKSHCLHVYYLDWYLSLFIVMDRYVLILSRFLMDSFYQRGISSHLRYFLSFSFEISIFCRFYFFGFLLLMWFNLFLTMRNWKTITWQHMPLDGFGSLLLCHLHLNSWIFRTFNAFPQESFSHYFTWYFAPFR